MHSMSKPTVLVGVSGSKASVGALRWAADESRRRGARLVAVRCWEPDQSAYYAPHGPIADDAHLHQAATWELASTLHEVFGSRLPASLYTEVIEGMAERVLADLVGGSGSPRTRIHVIALRFGPVDRTGNPQLPQPGPLPRRGRRPGGRRGQRRCSSR